MKCLQYSGCQIGHIWWWGEKSCHLDLHGVVRLAQGEPQDLQPGDRGLDWVKRFRNACVCMRVVFKIKAVCLKVKAQSKCWFIFKLISIKIKNEYWAVKNSNMEFNEWGHSFCETTGVNQVALVEGWSQHTFVCFSLWKPEKSESFQTLEP